MNILVVGKSGQLSRSLQEAELPKGVRLLALGRPECDLLRPKSLAGALEKAAPAVVVNAAGYNAVDRAETDEASAVALNAEGPEWLGLACRDRGIPLIQISTDYVFNGRKPAPYVEDDPTGPLNAYGRSKLEGERRLAAVLPEHVIVRTAWLHSPFGENFVKTILARGASRIRLPVVADQFGNPTYAPHLATALIVIAVKAANQRRGSPAVWGTYHAANSGETNWSGLAAEVFARAAEHGWSVPVVEPITAADYPSAATRPMNSRLDCGKLARVFGLVLPNWQKGVAACVERLAASERPTLAARSVAGAGIER